MRRSILPVAFAVLAALMSIPPALADPPVMEELPPALDVVDTFCGFPILFDVDEAQPGSVTTFFDQSGRLVRQIGTSPGLSVVGTNLETGESIAQNLSGQGIKEFFPDGSTTLTANGGWGIWPRMNGIRGRFITVGQVIELRDASGALVSRTLHAGRLIDVCAELAP